VLFRSVRRRGAYTREHARLHAYLGARIAAAVEKTLRLEELARANQAYSELLAFVTHELKSPVASIVTSAELLRDGYLGAVTPQQLETLQRILNKGRYMLELVRDYLELARVESSDVQFAPVPGVDFRSDVLAVALEMVEPLRQARGQRCEVEAPEHTPGLAVDPGLLRVAMVNLLSNAVKYGIDQGEIRIQVHHSDSELAVMVRNQGPGFAPSERARLFRKFSRLGLGDKSRVSGTGVGLYTVWRIVDLHGGRVHAESEPGHWAKFGFSIPQPLPEPGQPGPSSRYPMAVSR
jgi:signal transduction histidine kinase